MTDVVHTWDPDRYLTYADERARPFVDLLARVAAEEPHQVVDLGCGPGNLTRLLPARWPGAEVLGLDSSPEMVARAQESLEPGPRLRFEVGDLRDWTPSEPVDVLVSNATLQWLPDHLELLPRLVETVAPAGWLAFQVPGNLEEPSHTIRRDLAAEAPYDDHTAGAAVLSSYDPEVYLRTLVELGCEVDAWETRYLHVLRGEDPVFSWVSATGARPTLQALPDDLRPRFEEECRRRLREAYPPRAGAVLLPFRRIFVVARR